MIHKTVFYLGHSKNMGTFPIKSIVLIDTSKLKIKLIFNKNNHSATIALQKFMCKFYLKF
ncbi:hypothetical protein CDG68_09715 [Acinetobacter wuhouensis]|uniref:Uncharacterized protein n=1 Tax=Acinetobacter wuhouensis TaxID=1879050 RepID=A0A3G2T113_9GAMM|nr:hypothetical protein CDG68_09715 [Acinetobacter wuhouensis]